MKPKKIRHEGQVLGLVTPLDDGGCRLVLKPIYQRFPMLRRLVLEKETTTIDVDKPADEVAELVVKMAEAERTEETPEPSGGTPFELKGNTYPHRDTLKEHGLRWKPDREAWVTYNHGKFRRAVEDVGAVKETDRLARIPG